MLISASTDYAPMTIDDLAGVHAVDGAVEAELGIRSIGDGDLDPERPPGDDDPGDDGDEHDDPGDEGDESDEHDDLDDDGDEHDNRMLPFSTCVDVLLVRIDGTVHALWHDGSSDHACVARLDSPWWPFRRDGIVADLALGSPATAEVTLCNFFRRPADGEIGSAMVAVAETGPAAGMIVIEAGLEWRSRQVAGRSVLPLSSAGPLRPGSRHRISTRLQHAFRVDRIVIAEPDRWVVEDLSIGRASMLNGGALPGRMISGEALAIGVVGGSFDLSIEVSLADPSSVPRMFNSAVFGLTEPRIQRYLHFFARITPEGRNEAWLIPDLVDDP